MHSPVRTQIRNKGNLFWLESVIGTNAKRELKAERFDRAVRGNHVISAISYIFVFLLSVDQSQSEIDTEQGGWRCGDMLWTVRLTKSLYCMFLENILGYNFPMSFGSFGSTVKNKEKTINRRSRRNNSNTKEHIYAANKHNTRSQSNMQVCNHLPDIKMWEPKSRMAHSKSRLHQHPTPSTVEHHWGMEQHLAAQTEYTNVRDQKNLTINWTLF